MTTPLRIILLASVAFTFGCSSSSSPAGSTGTTTSIYGSLTGTTKVTVASGDSTVAGVMLTLIPSYRQVVSNPGGIYRFDSLTPGQYQLLAEKANLCYDTVSGFFAVSAGNTTTGNSTVPAILGHWQSRVSFTDGTYESGPLIFYGDQTVGIAYDQFNYIYGTWHMDHNTVTMALSGLDYSGIFTDHLITGIAQGGFRNQWRATR